VYLVLCDTPRLILLQTAAILHVFLLAMVLHPDAQRAAQAELDIVLGREQRLPMLADRAKLPYLTALLKEVHRYHPCQELRSVC
jgi:cytochrome P450